MSTSITEFNHLRIPLNDIQKATNNFSEENIIGKGGFGNVYKGKLWRWTTGRSKTKSRSGRKKSNRKWNISARRLERSQGQGDLEFWTEISVLSNLKHPNIVSLIGFCDEKGEKIIIHRYEAKRSLGMYLDDPALTWEHRLKICHGVANAISYLHYEEGRNYYIIHRNINSSTILLDNNFEAKLSGFEFSIKDSLDRMERYISSEVIFTQGYMDPETLKSGDVTQMSDVYSFGVVLCEILCGRKAFLPDESEVNKFLAPLVRSYFNNKILDYGARDIIHPDLLYHKTMCYEFALLAYECIKEDRVERPDMNQIILLLDIQLEYSLFPAKKDENDALKLSSVGESKVKRTPSNVWKVNKFEHLRIGLVDILLATENFSEKYAMFSPFDYCKYYKASLECFDREYNFSSEGKNKGELPKRDYDVSIKCINRNDMFYTEDTFYKEIEILGTCMHENIQPLLGFCDEGGHMILVHEDRHDCQYLLQILNSLFLTWEIRLKICLDIAHGLNYIQNEMEDQKMVIHRNISSDVIVWHVIRRRAIIIEFEQSTFLPSDQVEDVGHRMINSSKYLSTYIAPEYSDTGKATKESDIYSFGLVMFEILYGMYYSDLRLEKGKYVAQQWLKEGIIKQKMARAIREENFDNKKFLKKGPNEDSLDTFIKITEQCLAVNPEQRPTLQVIIQELEKALLFHVL